MTATINMLQGNQDMLLDQLQSTMASLQKTQVKLTQIINNQTVAPSLTASSNSASLSSDLSYTHEQQDASSKLTNATAANTHLQHATESAATDKKLYVPKFTFDPNDRINSSRWYKDVQSLLSASSYYNSLINQDGSINLTAEATIPNHNLYNILYRVVDEKFQKVAHSSRWSLGTDILTFVYNTFSDKTSFLDDAREAHSTLSNIRWNASKEELMEFAAKVADLYEKLKSTEYERIVTPMELRRIWIMALPSNIFSAIRGKITSNDQLPTHWQNATTISSLLAATQKEIGSQKAHATIANIYKKGTSNSTNNENNVPPNANKDGTNKTPQKSGDNQHRHPLPSDFQSPFDIMRAIESEVFKGLSIDELHKKYLITQDPTACILCRFKSTHKRHHHTKDCQEIQRVYKEYNKETSNISNSSVTVYYVSNPPCSTITNTSDKLCHDTGTPLHLFNDPKFFAKLTYYSSNKRPAVALGDDKTLLPIVAYGLADFIILTSSHCLKAYYVPALGTNLYSPTEHIKYQDCNYTLTHNTMITEYPTFTLKLNASDHFSDIIAPASHSMQPIDHDFTQTPLSTIGSDVKLQRLHPLAFLPYRATTGSVGYDLTTYSNVTIAPHQTIKIPLGFALEIPPKYRCQIASRSSLASKGIVVSGGVIDNDYRGDVTVILTNTTSLPFSISASSKIAQLLFIPSALPDIIQTTTLTPSLRSTNGFGSTDSQRTTLPCRRVNRHIPTLPSIIEANDETESSEFSQPVTHTNNTSQSHQKQSHQKPAPETHSDSQSLSHSETSDKTTTSTVATAPHHTVHQHHPPSRLRQTTLDLFLNLNSSISPSTQAMSTTHPTDSVSSTIPALVTMSSEMLQKCTGFRNITKITKLIKQHAAPTIEIQDLGRDPFLSRGEVATLPKSRRNTSPVPRPDTYGSVIHYDIGYGSGMSIGGYTHVIFLVDRATRKKFIYGLKSLHSSHIVPAMREFIKDLGCYPSKMLADRDFKIIGDQIKSLFRPNTFDHGNDLNFTGTHIAGAPQGRQNQNGLAEGNWKYICNMARNFLTENLLPRQFWFHALKYAVQYPTTYQSNSLMAMFQHHTN
jgi:deoxyuridine 5''-triphosphate nucleotidohydrolase (dut)